MNLWTRKEASVAGAESRDGVGWRPEVQEMGQRHPWARSHGLCGLSFDIGLSFKQDGEPRNVSEQKPDMTWFLNGHSGPFLFNKVAKQPPSKRRDADLCQTLTGRFVPLEPSPVTPRRM